MNYYVARNGQQFGPYPEEAVRSYLGAGSLFASDNIREETSQVWTTIGQLFQIPQAAPPVMMQPQWAPAQGQAYPIQGQVVPPDLHWFILLLLSITWIFLFIWAIVQALFARKIDQSSNAMWAFILWIALSVGSLVIAIQNGLGNAALNPSPLASLTSIGSFVCYMVGVFSIRKSMMSYYNSVEPIQLSLSGALTFFFGVFYLQYHMSRIAHWKKTGILSA